MAFHILWGDNVYEIIFQILYSEVVSTASFCIPAKVMSVASLHQVTKLPAGPQKKKKKKKKKPC